MLLNILSSISYTSPHTAVADPVGDIGDKRGAKAILLRERKKERKKEKGTKGGRMKEKKEK